MRQDDWPRDAEGFFDPEIGSWWVITANGSPIAGPFASEDDTMEAWSEALYRGHQAGIVAVTTAVVVGVNGG